MRSLTVTGLIAALTAGTVVLVAGAQEVAPPRAPFWPGIVVSPVIDEWYSDIPWHQKLGTYAGNEIDEALVLPYDALSAGDRAYCGQQFPDVETQKSRCMIELGI